MLRKLRITFSAVCGIVCLLLIVLWVRSYNGLSLLYRTQAGFPAVFAQDGSIWVIEEVDSPDVSRFSSGKMTRLAMPLIPLWFCTLVASASAAVPWLTSFRWSFTLRNLLIATTLVAVVLGLAVAFSS